VELLAFHEPPDYTPPARWLDRFARRRLDQRLWPAGDLRNLAGATLTARSVTESARLALALYETVVVPALAPPAPGEGR
ncbi:MAG: FMN-binding protein, partial [Candidatus Eiseniibacteriota bacterium]